MSTRFVISSAVCSASDREGTTILNIEKGLVYSLIGVASRAWSSLTQHPQGLTLEEMITSIKHDVPQIDKTRVRADIERLLYQLHQKELVHIGDRSNRRRFALRLTWLRAIVKMVMRFALTFRMTCSAAFLQLLLFDLTLSLSGFHGLHNMVKNWPLTVKTDNVDDDYVVIVNASMDRAIRYYPRNSLCLQRSAALTCLLRSCAVPAEMIIACRRIPFKGHAWVEVNGKVVNDSPRVQIVCNSVLERC